MNKYYGFFENDLNMVTISMKKETYLKTTSGKSWKSKPETVENETISADFYKNYVDSVPFFNNFGYGASCRAYKGYCMAGYIPVKVVTISPQQEKKIVTTFYFN